MGSAKSRFASASIRSAIRTSPRRRGITGKRLSAGPTRASGTRSRRRSNAAPCAIKRWCATRNAIRATRLTLGVIARDIACGDDRQRLVDRHPVLDAIPETARHDLRVIGEPPHRSHPSAPASGARRRSRGLRPQAPRRALLLSRELVFYSRLHSSLSASERTLRIAPSATPATSVSVTTPSPCPDCPRIRGFLDPASERSALDMDRAHHGPSGGHSADPRLRHLRADRGIIRGATYGSFDLALATIAQLRTNLRAPSTACSAITTTLGMLHRLEDWAFGCS